MTELNLRTANASHKTHQNRLESDRLDQYGRQTCDGSCHLDHQHEFFEGIAQRTHERQRNATDPTGFDSLLMGGKACRQHHLEPCFPRGTRKVDPV